MSLSHLAIHPWVNIIARLCLRSTLGQTSSHDFACNLSLSKHYHRTLLTIHPWANIIVGLFLRSTLSQTSSQDFTCDPLLVNLICPWPIRNLLVYPFTLRFFCLCWASFFHFNLVVVTKLSRVQFWKLQTQWVSQPVWKKKFLSFDQTMAGARTCCSPCRNPLPGSKDEPARGLPGVFTKDSNTSTPFLPVSQAQTPAQTPATPPIPSSTEELCQQLLKTYAATVKLLK